MVIKRSTADTLETNIWTKLSHKEEVEIKWMFMSIFVWQWAESVGEEGIRRRAGQTGGGAQAAGPGLLCAGARHGAQPSTPHALWQVRLHPNTHTHTHTYTYRYTHGTTCTVAGTATHQHTHTHTYRYTHGTTCTVAGKARSKHTYTHTNTNTTPHALWQVRPDPNTHTHTNTTPHALWQVRLHTNTHTRTYRYTHGTTCTVAGKARSKHTHTPTQTQHHMHCGR